MTGGQNLDLLAQYEAVNDPEHEFVFSLQVDHQVGTGNNNVDSSRQSATQPAMTFGKGFGDVPIEALRPFAVTGFVGYQIAEGSGTRPNQINTGFSLQYSVPYLVSKVTPLDLPTVLRGIIPTVEVMWSVPTGNTHHTGNTPTVAPGINYSQGAGWEVGIEAMIPANIESAVSRSDGLALRYCSDISPVAAVTGARARHPSSSPQWLSGRPRSCPRCQSASKKFERH
jgi:hypothetical protein